MSIKWIGAVMVIACCGWFGFSMAAAHRREESTLRKLIGVLDYIECELQYHLTPLPELCRQAASETTGVIRAVFTVLATELDDQISPDVGSCMDAVLARIHEIPKITKYCLQLLGKSLGRFDLQGQLSGLSGVRQQCRQELQSMCVNKEVRLRSYQTLGLCAGAALVILFI